MDDRARPQGYVPPPAFAPPTLRIAPLNEYQVLGRSSYPPAAQSPQSAHWAGYYARVGYQAAPQSTSAYAPVPWHPALGAGATRPGKISRRITVVIGTTVVAALVAVITLLTIASPSQHSSRSLSVPESAGAYSRVSTVSGAQLQNGGSGTAFGSSFPAADLVKARIGLFSRDSRAPTLVFIGFLADDSPTIGAELRTTEPVTVIDEVFGGTGSSVTPIDLDPGPLGGALEAADIDVSGESVTIAVWADQDTLGIVMDYSPTGRASISEMADLALAMRAAAEK